MNHRAIFFALIWAAVLALPAHSQRVAEPAAPQLNVVIRTDHETYRLADTLRLETQLVNTGDGDVYIWTWDLCWNPARGLSLRLIAPDGSLAKGTVLLDCVPPPPLKQDPYQFIKLEPLNFHRRVDNFKLSDFVAAPGDYQIEVTFSSFLSPKWIREFYADQPVARLPLWTMAEPSLKSERVHLRILP
jgi:hypothetical protein